MLNKHQGLNNPAGGNGKQSRDSSRKVLKTAALAVVGLVVLTIVGLTALNWYVIRTCTTALNRTVRTLAPLSAITYQGIKVSPFGRRVSLAGIAIKPAGSSETITIDRLLLENIDVRHPIPHRLNLEARGVNVPGPEAFGSAGPAVKALGYKSLTVDLALSYAYDQRNNILVVNKMLANVREAGEISLAVTLSDVGESDLEALIVRQSTAACRQWLIVQAQLVYRDDSCIKRFLYYQAKNIGETLPQLRYGMSVDLEQTISTEKDDFTRASLQQFRAFIANLKYLEITARPDKPVSYSDLKKACAREGIKGLIPSLKLTFSAHQP